MSTTIESPPAITPDLLDGVHIKAIAGVYNVRRIIGAFPDTPAKVQPYKRKLQIISKNFADLDFHLHELNVRAFIEMTQPQGPPIISCGEECTTCWHALPLIAAQALEDLIGVVAEVLGDVGQSKAWFNGVGRRVIQQHLEVLSKTNAIFRNPATLEISAMKRTWAELRREYVNALRHLRDMEAECPSEDEAESAPAVDEWVPKEKAITLYEEIGRPIGKRPDQSVQKAVRDNKIRTRQEGDSTLYHRADVVRWAENAYHGRNKTRRKKLEEKEELTHL